MRGIKNICHLHHSHIYSRMCIGTCLPVRVWTFAYVHVRLWVFVWCKQVHVYNYVEIMMQIYLWEAVIILSILKPVYFQKFAIPPYHVLIYSFVSVRRSLFTINIKILRSIINIFIFSDTPHEGGAKLVRIVVSLQLTRPVFHGYRSACTVCIEF